MVGGGGGGCDDDDGNRICSGNGCCVGAVELMGGGGDCSRACDDIGRCDNLAFPDIRANSRQGRHGSCVPCWLFVISIGGYCLRFLLLNNECKRKKIF